MNCLNDHTAAFADFSALFCLVKTHPFSIGPQKFSWQIKKKNDNRVLDKKDVHQIKSSFPKVVIGNLHRLKIVRWRFPTETLGDDKLDLRRFLWTGKIVFIGQVSTWRKSGPGTPGLRQAYAWPITAPGSRSLNYESSFLLSVFWPRWRFHNTKRR